MTEPPDTSWIKMERLSGPSLWTRLRKRLAPVLRRCQMNAKGRSNAEGDARMTEDVGE
jgi:hypothetical protein